MATNAKYGLGEHDHAYSPINTRMLVMAFSLNSAAHSRWDGFPTDHRRHDVAMATFAKLATQTSGDSRPHVDQALVFL